MSYLPLQDLFTLDTEIKQAILQSRQIVPMWDETAGVPFYSVSYWNAVTGAMDIKQITMDMGAVYTPAGGNVLMPLEAKVEALQTETNSTLTSIDGFVKKQRVLVAMWDAGVKKPFWRTLTVNDSGAIVDTLDYDVDMVATYASSGNVIAIEERLRILLDTISQTLSSGLITYSPANPQIADVNASTLNALAIPVTDVATTKYKKIQFQVTGTFSMTLTAQVSNSTTYIAIPVKNVNTGVLATTVTSAGIYVVDVSVYRNFRLLVTAYVSGVANVTSFGVYDSTDVSIPTVTTQAVSGTVAVSGNPAVVLTPLVTAGASPLGAFVSAPSGTQTVAAIKGSGGVLYGLAYAVTQGTLGSQGEVYLRFYNQVALPTVGTTVPAHVLRLTSDGNGYISFGDMGIRFATGITIAITGAIANTPTNTSVASSVSFFGI